MKNITNIDPEISCKNCTNLKYWCELKEQFVQTPILTTCRDRKISKKKRGVTE